MIIYQKNLFIDFWKEIALITAEINTLPTINIVSIKETHPKSIIKKLIITIRIKTFTYYLKSLSAFSIPSAKKIWRNCTEFIKKLRKEDL